jgi:hypothetical protein
MARRFLPGADDDAPSTVKALHGRLVVLSGRLDTVEATLTGHGDDLAAIGKALAVLRGSSPSTTPREATSAPQEAENADQGPRDWLKVEDPEQAAEWLNDAGTWLREVGACHRLTLPPCWPLHPDVVTEVLALVDTRTAAYASTPEAVAEWLTRWLPGARERVGEDVNACEEAGGHLIGRTPYAVSGLPVAEVARWWATDRATRPDIPLRAWMRAMDPR